MISGPISSSNLAKYFSVDNAVDDILENYNADFEIHLRMLNNQAASNVHRQALAYIRNLPFIDISSGVTARSSAADKKRFQEIDRELSFLADTIEDGQKLVERETINTARAVMHQISQRSLAPPELARLSSDAVVMLWALGQTKYAITITDSDVGYVVRSPTATLKKKSNISVAKFDVRKLA